VPISEKTIPNPYLDEPNRDITGPSGTRLTLMNHAYMTRQVHELAKEAYNVHGHITSLKPIRPENAPDPWEARALGAFEAGKEEVSSVEEIEGESYMRLMRPLMTEKDCLRCHADQGYELGDVRGGLSVAIPMAPLSAVERSRVLSLSLAHGLIWLTGLAGIGLGMHHLSRQVKERRRAEETLREANQKLVELESLKEDLTNMVVHDMKNPIATTMMALDLMALESGDQLKEQQAEVLDMAKRNQFDLSEMIGNLLEISKIESGQLQVTKASIDIPDFVHRIVDRCALPARNKEISVHVSIDPNARRIFSDEKLLDRTLANLISNAIKHSYPKGKIYLEVAPAPGENEIMFLVRDFGEGIPKELHEKIFDRFCQADLRELGDRTDTGLGLTFCKLAVEALGGRICVESDQGKGSCFIFSLPGALVASEV